MKLNKTLLKKLYWTQKLSIGQIAQKSHCHPFVIHRAMKKYKIKTRSLSEAKRKFVITKKELKKLYEIKKLSTDQIAKRFEVSHATVLNRMKEFGIKRRSRLGTRKPVKIAKHLLKKLYKEKKLSQAQIAKKLGYSCYAIQLKIKKFRIKSRSLSEANTKYPKKNFSKNLLEKAYLIGFRIGDLNVYRKDFVIRVRCSTTVPEQIQLIKNIFSPYSQVIIRKSRILKGRQVFDVDCYQNNTFDFLLPKKDEIPKWILSTSKFFFAFIAGYVDAEGHIFTRLQKRSKTPIAGFEVQSYDKKILYQTWLKLNQLNIQCPKPKINKPKGYTSKSGAVYRKDLWRLAVNRKTALSVFLNSIEPHVKHGKRKTQLLKAKQNLIFRLKNELTG